MQFGKVPRSGVAFARADLIVTLGVLFLVGLLQSPAVGHVKDRSHTLRCLDNLRQLTLAWLLYTHDANGFLPGNLDGGDAQTWGNTNRTWAVGWLDNSVFRPDNTNSTILLNSQLGRYVNGNASLYRCPADPSLTRRRTGVPRVRSVSMNSYMGDRAGPYSAGFRQFKRLSQITSPIPAAAFVFVCERDDSINDGCFFISMGGADPLDPNAYTILDYPADWHERGSNLSFVDGHVENWHWQDSRTMPLHQLGWPLPLGLASPNNPDVARIHAAASVRLDR